MKVSELRGLLKSLPGDAEVALVDYHEPMQNLGPDEYDDYAGMPNGKFRTIRATYDSVNKRVVIDRW